MITCRHLKPNKEAFCNPSPVLLNSKTSESLLKLKFSSGFFLLFWNLSIELLNCMVTFQVFLTQHQTLFTAVDSKWLSESVESIL